MAISTTSGKGLRAQDPLRNFKFRVAIGDLNYIMGFRRVSGLNQAMESVPYRSGGDDLIPVQLPGVLTNEPITLEHGATLNVDLWNWFKQVYNIEDPAKGSSGQFRANVLIGIFNPYSPSNGAQKAERTYEVRNAWPRSIGVADLDAMSSEILLETMQLVHEGVYLKETNDSFDESQNVDKLPKK